MECEHLKPQVDILNASCFTPSLGTEGTFTDTCQSIDLVFSLSGLFVHLLKKICVKCVFWSYESV